MSQSLLLTLNVDWFGPFNNSTYPCGAMYLTINNLPRAERCKTENVILVGVMPGPHEASTSDMNHYLRPLVDDLVEWYTGHDIFTAEARGDARVHVALLNVACDIPAARKVSGFTSHASCNACHKCDRHFTTFPDTGHNDYSGFDVDTWIARDPEVYRQYAEQWRDAATRDDRLQIERDHGARYSELHRLHYLDPVRCTIVDPMHNLFLGMVKRMTKKWLDDQDLTLGDLRQMQRIADTIILPPDYVSLKKKIESSFSFMTAVDWKSWCLVYSPIVLNGRLPLAKLRNWLCFVDACRTLVIPSITETEVHDASTYLLEFCRGVQEIYSDRFVTSNMHLHMHLTRTIEDFGPLYSYWLFSFERYNGYLKDIDTNQKDSFEITFMKKFQEKTGVCDFVQSLELRFRAVPGYLMFLNRFMDRLQPAQQTFAITTPDFDVHAFYALSKDMDVIGNVKGSEPLPLDAYPLKVNTISHMPRDDYLCLLEFYREQYDSLDLVDYRNPIGQSSCCQRPDRNNEVNHAHRSNVPKLRRMIS